MLDRAANFSAAHYGFVNGDGPDSDDIEIVLSAQFFQQSEIAGATFTKRPFVSDTNFTQRTRMLNELVNEFLRWSCGKLFVESQNEQMGHAEGADERDLMLRRGQQMWRFLWSQDLCRMWIKRDHHRCASASAACSADVRMTA